jgi:16S rRNA (cytosine967-C5)-methyltransferase
MNDYLTVLEILNEVFEGRNLNESFASNISSDRNNVSKIKDVCYGLIRNYYIIKIIIEDMVKNKPSDIRVLLILYIGIYELKFTKKPPYAISNDLVELTYHLTDDAKIKGFVNAIIRGFIRNKESIEDAIKSKSEYKYNFPIWMISKLKQEYPKRYLEIMANSSIIPKLALRVNLRKSSFTDYQKLLDKDSYILIDNKIVLTNSIKIENIPLFKDGYVSIQDVSAQKLIEIATPNDGDDVLDACAAPGGKTCQLLENCNINLTSMDIDDERLNKVRQNLERLQLNATLINADASTWRSNKQYDFIIADVPCSASGTLKRNPDIKLQRKLSDIAKFVNTQQKIVRNLWSMLKPGGRLIYITCSIFKEENHDNLEYFMQNLSGVKKISELNIIPTEYMDGFYYCVLGKEKHADL